MVPRQLTLYTTCAEVMTPSLSMTDNSQSQLAAVKTLEANL